MNTNVRGLMQPGDVTTRYVTMDTYLVVQCAIVPNTYADTQNRLSVVSYYLFYLSSFIIG